MYLEPGGQLPGKHEAVQLVRAVGHEVALVALASAHTHFMLSGCDKPSRSNTCPNCTKCALQLSCMAVKKAVALDGEATYAGAVDFLQIIFTLLQQGLIVRSSVWIKGHH